MRIERVSLALPRWPAELDGLRVAALSDLHTGAPHVDEHKLERVVERVNAELPHLVALLGDYTDPEVVLGRRIPPEAVAERLAGLRAPLGAVAVLGNHDWEHFGARVVTALHSAGITVLENDAVERRLRGQRLWLAGLADATERSPSLETFAQVPEGEPVIALSHHPDLFPAIPARVALTLSGHTHGSQVDLPLVRDRVTPSRFGSRYAGGHVEEDGKHLYVSRGVGTSRLPVRLLAPPEIAVLELRAGAG